jgi:hypothetical protein
MAAFLKQLTFVSGDGDARTIYKAGRGKRKRVSRALRPLERGHFRLLKAGSTFADELLDRHRKSRTKRRNGWLRQSPRSFMKASRKALKKLAKF